MWSDAGCRQRVRRLACTLHEQRAESAAGIPVARSQSRPDLMTPHAPTPPAPLRLAEPARVAEAHAGRQALAPVRTLEALDAAPAWPLLSARIAAPPHGGRGAPPPPP